MRHKKKAGHPEVARPIGVSRPPARDGPVRDVAAPQQCAQPPPRDEDEDEEPIEPAPVLEESGDELLDGEEPDEVPMSLLLLDDGELLLDDGELSLDDGELPLDDEVSLDDGELELLDDGELVLDDDEVPDASAARIDDWRLQ